MAETRAVFTVDRANLFRRLFGADGIAFRKMEDLGRRIETNAKHRVPVRTGNLRRSIGHSVKVEGKKLKLDVFATAKYASYVESGTLPHIITPKRKGGVLVFKAQGRTVFATYAKHPGTKPTFFLRKAVEDELRKNV